MLLCLSKYSPFGRYPSHARMWMAPIRSGLVDQKLNDYEGSMDDWHCFLDDTRTCYGVDMSILTKPFAEEQKKWYLQVCPSNRVPLDVTSFLFSMF